jgi:hypothetical protein
MASTPDSGRLPKYKRFLRNLCEQQHDLPGIIFFQETRITTAHRLSMVENYFSQAGYSFVGTHSAGGRGKHGMGIAVKKAESSSLVVHISSPRLMVASVCYNGWELLLVNNHTPNTHHSRESHLSFLTSTVQQHKKPSQFVIAGGDWNSGQPTGYSLYPATHLFHQTSWDIEQAFVQNHGLYDACVDEGYTRLNTVDGNLTQATRIDRLYIPKIVRARPKTHHTGYSDHMWVMARAPKPNNQQPKTSALPPPVPRLEPAQVESLWQEWSACFPGNVSDLDAFFSWISSRTAEMKQRHQTPLNPNSVSVVLLKRCIRQLPHHPSVRHYAVVDKIFRDWINDNLEYTHTPGVHTPARVLKELQSCDQTDHQAVYVFLWNSLNTALHFQDIASLATVQSLDDSTIDLKAAQQTISQFKRMSNTQKPMKLEPTSFRDSILYKDFSAPFADELDHWLEQFRDTHTLDPSSSPRLSQAQIAALHDRLTFDEVTKIIHTLPWNSSPGHDGIPYHVLKTFSQQIGVALTDLFNGILFEGVPIPDAWHLSTVKPIPKPNGEARPISLQPAIYKLFSKVLESRLKVLWSVIPHHQFGFRPGKEFGCARALSDVLVWDSANEHNPRFRATLDIKKAFDTISHRLVLTMLKFYGIPQLYLNVLALLLDLSVIQVFWKGELSPTASVLCGVKQGDPLSPLLFAVGFSFLSLLIWHLTTSPECVHPGTPLDHSCWLLILYADDIFLGVSNPTEQLTSEISRALDIFQRISNLYFHSGPNQSKSVLQSSPECWSLAGRLLLNGLCLSIVSLDQPVKYLGIQLADTLNNTIKLTMLKIETSTMKSANMISAFCHPWNLSLKAQLINSYVVTKLYYPAQVLPFPKSLATSLSAIWRRCLSSFPLGAMTGSIEGGGIGIKPPYESCLILLNNCATKLASTYLPQTTGGNQYLQRINRSITQLGKITSLSKSELAKQSMKELTARVMKPNFVTSPQRLPTTCIQLRCAGSNNHQEQIYTNLNSLKSAWPSYLVHWVWKFQRRLNMATSVRDVSCVCGTALSPKHSINCFSIRHTICQALSAFHPDLWPANTALDKLWTSLTHISPTEKLTLPFWVCMKAVFESLSSLTSSSIISQPDLLSTLHSLQDSQ